MEHVKPSRAQQRFDDYTTGYRRWPPAECRARLVMVRRLAGELSVLDHRFVVVRWIAEAAKQCREQGKNTL